MKQQSRRQPIWLPLAIAVAVVVGLFIGNRLSPSNYAADNDRKVNAILNLINQDYVDSTNLKDLVEMSIPEILSNLDPHTSYISAEEFKSSNESASGMTSDIGIQYEPINDTITIIEVIPGGPSAKVGLKAGDRIVSIDDTTTIGEKVTKGAIAKRLRGPKGSKVKLGIKRLNSNKTLTFTVTRGNIPVNTVDAHYMLDKNTGYVKVNQFGRNTYREFMQAMIKLKDEGAKRYMIDLRGNGGGFMEMAVRMVNEFLPANQLIVYTHGRYKRNDREWWSDGDGRFQDAEVAVLIDEFSASASEIFAGAMQDWDRGVIVGRRTFGKGLVQSEYHLPDGSQMRLTIARYHTPSGRVVQTPYEMGHKEAYYRTAGERFARGESFSRDSIVLPDSLQFKTLRLGRTVYGGGGIVPDVFVPYDTTGHRPFLIRVIGTGALTDYANEYIDKHRDALAAESVKQFEEKYALLSTAAFDGLIAYAAEKELVPESDEELDACRAILATRLKALLARSVLGTNGYWQVINAEEDPEFQKALEVVRTWPKAFNGL